MNKPLFLLAAALALPAGAQPEDSAAERARITAERTRADAQFEEAQKACYAKFAVNDCIGRARAQRRDVMADLRRQELSLNEADRRRRSAERLKEIESRTPPQPQPRAAGEPREAPEPRTPGEPAANRAAQPETAASAPRRRAAAAPRAPRQQERPDAEANARRYDERLRQAQEHKAKVEKKAAESANKDVKPLPVPP